MVACIIEPRHSLLNPPDINNKVHFKNVNINLLRDTIYYGS
jgi:hypothetical protein